MNGHLCLDRLFCLLVCIRMRITRGLQRQEKHKHKPIHDGLRMCLECHTFAFYGHLCALLASPSPSTSLFFDSEQRMKIVCCCCFFMSFHRDMNIILFSVDEVTWKTANTFHHPQIDIFLKGEKKNKCIGNFMNWTINGWIFKQVTIGGNQIIIAHILFSVELEYNLLLAL